MYTCMYVCMHTYCTYMYTQVLQQQLTVFNHDMKSVIVCNVCNCCYQNKLCFSNNVNHKTSFWRCIHVYRVMLKGSLHGDVVHMNGRGGD